MSNKIRAKFNVTSITEFGNSGGKQITLQPVINGSEENKKFWAYTPSGEIKIHVENENANFDFGEYYIDFTKAE